MSAGVDETDIPQRRRVLVAEKRAIMESPVLVVPWWFLTGLYWSTLYQDSRRTSGYAALDDLQRNL
jgi:hypothetical protein